MMAWPCGREGGALTASSWLLLPVAIHTHRVYASGLTPLICNALSSSSSLPHRPPHTRSPLPVCAYVLAVGALSGLFLLAMRPAPAPPAAAQAKDDGGTGAEATGGGDEVKEDGDTSFP